MPYIAACFCCILLFALAIKVGHGKGQGFISLLACLLLLAAAFYFLFNPFMPLSLYAACALLAVAAVFVAVLVLCLVRLGKQKSTAARCKRQVLCAGFSAPLALFVGVILSFYNVEEKGVLVCLSAAVFGGLALIIALNLILISFFEYKSTRECFEEISAFFSGKKLLFLRVSLAKDGFQVLGKLVLCIASLSFFMFANALYSGGLGAARFIALKMHGQTRRQQVKSYFYVGAVIFISSFFYALYSARLFYSRESQSYSMVMGISIACYTFFEFGMNIRDILRNIKSKALEAKALRAIGFSSTLLCFVLTQTAIMSFASTGDNSMANAVGGIFFGGAAALLGVYIMLRSIFLKKELDTENALEIEMEHKND